MKESYIDCRNETRCDLTGRDQLVSNVIFNWAGHFVLIVAGFIMPRMIDRRLGQDVLGIWDFAWSLVSYFNLVEFGIGGSVSRYVARYRMVGDVDGINRTVSSASFILAILGMLVLSMTIAVSLLLPQVFGTQLGENTREAQYVLVFLGTGVAVQIAFGAFGGILTGCHQWKLLNLILCGGHAAATAGMIIAVLMDYGLRTLSFLLLLQIVVSRAIVVIVAHRVCGGLRVRILLIEWKTITNLYKFGVKSLIPLLSRLFVTHNTGVLITAYLGPAALALYCRPRALVLHTDKLVQGMARTLTPTASSLQSSGDWEEIRYCFMKSVQCSFYVVLPIVLLLTIFGGTILQVWMGHRYANDLIPAILALGVLMPVGQSPAIRILMGLNAHGRPGLAEFIASLCSAVLLVVELSLFKWGLAGAALSVTLPLTIMNVVYLPRLVCHKVGLDVRRYFLFAIARPSAHVVPYALCLAIARIVFNNKPLVGLIWGGATGTVILAIMYWRYALPETIRERVSDYVRVSKFMANAKD